MFPTRLMSPPVLPTEGFYASEVETPQRLPVLTFLPTGFEPNYAYPLVVFFHGRGGSERQVIRLAPRLSRRNYICIGLRGPDPMLRARDGRLGYNWGSDGRADAFAEEYLFRAVEQAQETYTIHPERIFLAGISEGAAHAYRLGLAFPQYFAGIIALNGRMPKTLPLLRLQAVRNLRVLIGHGIANVQVPLSSARRDFRLLYSAGLDVRLHTYLTTHRLHPTMLRDIDRWMIDMVTANSARAPAARN